MVHYINVTFRGTLNRVIFTFSHWLFNQSWDHCSFYCVWLLAKDPWTERIVLEQCKGETRTTCPPKYWTTTSFLRPSQRSLLHEIHPWIQTEVRLSVFVPNSDWSMNPRLNNEDLNHKVCISESEIEFWNWILDHFNNRLVARLWPWTVFKISRLVLVLYSYR